jgi:flagellar M-ring protein FliF
MNPLLEGLKALGPARLAAMGVVAVGLLALLGVLILRSGGGSNQMALLYADLDLRDSAQIVDQLNKKHIPYRLLSNGSQILVPSEQVADARLALARDGLPSGGSVGYELFDRGDGLAFTEFQQKINETRALEGEIARTIKAIRGIRQARVHLVLPRREPFARDRQDAQASVMLTMAGAQRLDREATQAILNLVAAAVPGLTPRNIAVVDSRGDLLARAGQPVGQSAEAASADETRRGTELRLSRAVEEILERSLGPGRVRAEAAVRMNYDRVNETKESYDPDGQVTRSSQTVSSNSKTTEANGTVSVQNNLPNADAGAPPGAGTQEGKQEETTNYEIGKTVRTLIREQPQIERISLAVMVDGTMDASKTWQPMNAENLARITTLVKSTIGFDEKRGDQVNVVSMRFAEPEALAPETAGFLGIKLEKAELMTLAQTGLIGIIGLLALLLVLRPMVKGITALSPTVAGALGAPGEQSAAGHLGGAGAAAIAGGANKLLLNGPMEEEGMVDIAQIEGQIRASSLRKLSEMVEKHPSASLNILRGWMARDNA